MIEKKKFEFLSYTIVVEIRDKPPTKWDERACGGCYDKPDENINFRIWFSLDKNIPNIRTIAHECWHLFMTIMNYIDKFNHTFEELNNEIYAYNYHILFGNVFDCVINSKAYSKILESKE